MSRKWPKTAGKKAKNDQNWPFKTQNDLKITLFDQKTSKNHVFNPKMPSSDRVYPKIRHLKKNHPVPPISLENRRPSLFFQI